MFKTKFNQRGVAHLGLIIIALIVLAGAGAAIWRVSSHNKDSSSSSGGTTATTNKQTEDACNQAINDATLCKFAASFNLNAAYKATATTTGGDSNGTLTIESDGKGNTSLSGTSDGQSIDTITIGNTSYIKDESSGTWMKYTSDASTTTNPADDFKLSASDITGNGTITYKYISKEACSNLTCYKYQEIDKGSSNTEYFWFDTKDYQLRRFTLTDPSSGTTDMSFTYQGVSITAPANAMEMTQ